MTFPEFAIWWYHFFYTAVTERLIADHVIDLPLSHNVTFLAPRDHWSTP